MSDSTLPSFKDLVKSYVIWITPVLLLANYEGAKNNDRSYFEHLVEMWWLLLGTPLILAAVHLLILTMSRWLENKTQ